MELKSLSRRKIKSEFKLPRKYSMLLVLVIVTLFLFTKCLYLFCAYSFCSGIDAPCAYANDLCSFFGDDLRPVVNLAVVACGDNVEEAMNSVKSAVVFGRDVRLNVILFVDKNTETYLEQRMRKLRNSAKKLGVDFSYRVQDYWFPPDDEEVWRKMFKPCASQRLFFPSVLPDLETIIYVDSDTLFLSSVKDLWDEFEIMRRENQMAAMAHETELTASWYSLHAKIPYYGKRGLNSGVMLMNLTLFRQLNAEKDLLDIYTNYTEKLVWPDQDILNLYFVSYPKRLHELSCEFNYRFHHCHCLFEGDCSCKSAIQNGISVLHGTSRTFHKNNNYGFFPIVYDTFMTFNLDHDKPYMLANRLRKTLEISESNATSNCSRLEFNDVFKKLTRYLES